MPFATLKNSGHKVHYMDTQDAQPERGQSRPPIVMIHGLGSSQNYYAPVIPYAPDFRCVALDSYGAARSKSQGEDMTLQDLAEDVIGLMDGLGIDKAVVAGHSMGGPVALLVAATHPERVAGVVAIGPVNPTSVKPEMFTARIETVLKDGMEPLANSIPTAATGKNSTALQRALVRELLLNQEPKAYAAHCKAIVGMKEPAGGFEAIKTPVLILTGDEDTSAPLAGCQYILEHLGSSKKDLKVLKGVGHWHCVEAGERVGDEISVFASAL